MSAKRSTLKHGLSYTAEYRAWQQMRLRCIDPEHAAYPDYGGRGITVCDRWLQSPEAFLADMGLKPTAAHELDRRDNDKGYEPGNCRWVLRDVNCRNRRSSRVVEHDGQRLTVAEWAEKTGMGASTIIHRLDSGWSPERALTQATRLKSPNGQSKSYTQPCCDCGTQSHGLRCRPCENRARPQRSGNHSDASAVQEAA